MRRTGAGGALALLVTTLVLTTTSAAGEGVFRFEDPDITESSAVVEVGRGPDRRVLTINDSGDGPVVFVVDPRTGRTTGRSTYAGDAVDVEALTEGRNGEVWVGDIGDNAGVRAGVQVYRLPPLSDGDREVPSTRYDLAYPGGARDAEALLVHPRTGRLFVVTKGLLGGQVFAAPRRLRSDRPNALQAVGRAPGIITDGAFFRNARHVVLRDYSRAYVLDTTRLPWRRVAGFELPDQLQGEGVAVRRGGRSLLISGEGEREPLLEVPIPRRVLAAMRPSADTEAEDGPSRLDVLTQEGAVPWTLVGGVVGCCALLWVALRLRRAARRRSRSTR